jgi:hypothetical protein
MSCRAVGVFALLVSGLLLARPSWSGQVIVGIDADRDLWHTIQARKLLADDPELAGLNLGVRVRNRVATLWGPVPTPDLAFKAEIRLRNLIELVDVHNELFVTGEPTVDPPEVAPAPAQPLFLPEQLPPALPPASDGWLRKVQKPASRELELPPLRVPQAPGGASTTARKQDADRLLADAIETLVRSNAAFRPLRYTVRDRTVYLADPGRPTPALTEFARAVARLPGVEGVVLPVPAPIR